jgi:hypothetical protein
MSTFPLLFPLSSPTKIVYTFCLLRLLHILPYRRLFGYNNIFDKAYNFFYTIIAQVFVIIPILREPKI